MRERREQYRGVIRKLKLSEVYAIVGRPASELYTPLRMDHHKMLLYSHSITTRSFRTPICA